MESNLQNELSNLLTNVKSINNDKRLSWDQYFMTIATVTSLRSPCERLKVGCVLVKDKRIISTGYNGFLPGAKHESIVRDNHEQATVHAEQNTISNASKNGINTDNTTAYVTHFTCINCFKTLASAGVKKIYYLEDYKNDENVYKISQDEGLDIEIIKFYES